MSKATHIHVASGHEVVVLHEATAQVNDLPINDMSALVVYEHKGRIWVRHATEFERRFVEVA